MREREEKEGLFAQELHGKEVVRMIWEVEKRLK